jgi:hypothetical protein
MQDIVTSKLIGNSRVKTVLQRHGYTVVTFASGPTYGIAEPDIYLSPPGIPEAKTWQMGFEMLLLDTSWGQFYLRLKGDQDGPLQQAARAHRERILYALAHLTDFAQADGDYYVYAHILAPHVPYVFGPNGEEITLTDPYTLLDVHEGQEQNVGRYRDQVHYLNTLVMDTIDQILAKSDTPPIIILQGDHSSKVYRQLDPPDEIQAKLLLPILNACLLPGKDGLLFPSITPVNTYRIVFNHYFQADLALLEDTSFIFDNNHGDFVDACAFYGVCP